MKGIRTIAVNGYEMAYLECGQGAPLVLIHGSLNDYRAWVSQVEPFGECFRTIAVSLRHCYPECWNGDGETFSVRQHADDLAEFIKKLGAGSIHLVAHSRGGDIALILAAKYPELVRSMVLADPAPLDQMLLKTPDAIAETEYRKTFVTAAVELLEQGDVDGGLELFTDAVSMPGTWSKLSESSKQVRRDNVWSLKSLVTDAQAPFNRLDAGNIDVPILLVTGDNSPRLYAMMHTALRSHLKRHQMITIPNASHGMYTDNPAAFNAAVLDFLKKNTPQGALTPGPIGEKIMEMRIQLAEKDHVDDCLSCVKHSELWETYFQSSPTIESEIRKMIVGKQIYIALDKTNQCIGFMGVIDNGCFRKFTYLSVIAVKREYRSKGIGKALIRKFEEIGFENANRVFLLVSDFNKKAQSFYKKLGYKKVGEIPDLFKKGVAENLLVKYE